MKLGILGSGMIVKEFLTITKYLEGIELTAILGTERSRENVEKLKREYNIKNAFYIIHLIVPYYFAIINSAEAFGSKLFLKKPKLCSLFLISVPSSIRSYHQSPLI